MPARSPLSRVTDEPRPVSAGTCRDARRFCEICALQIGLPPSIVARQSQRSQTSVRLDALRKCVGRALIVELILVRLTILGLSFGPLAFESREMTANFIGRKHTSHFETNEEAPWRKPDAQRRRWRDSSVFLRAHSQTGARRRNAGSRSFGSGPSWTMSHFRNRGLGPDFEESRAFCFFHFVHLAAIV